MTPVDWTHLAKFEQEWVALDKEGKVFDHSATLAALRRKLGDTTNNFTYFFVPPTKLGFAGSCRI